MRCHQVDAVQRRVAEPEEMGQLMCRRLLVIQGRTHRSDPGDLRPFGAPEYKRPSFNGVSINRLYR